MSFYVQILYQLTVTGFYYCMRV